MMKIVLHRGFPKLVSRLLTDSVGQYEGKVVDLLGNSEYNVPL
jgi:hypothetical protein